ncbi:hypothetical protein B0J11DRAFT_302263 [Dendryphion nanum]|uniref:F-box domain-containing protein n=1 Tax=Dendryphion nanum TaxID=256645 RepID=A0A9P9DT90_9PLEO|nr:hypothetical protein B0J11DRAFT_302263 [Dendryphion nanum]
MARLLVLPVELLHDIAGYLEGEIRTLISLCRSSKTLRLVAQPLIYREVRPLTKYAIVRPLGKSPDLLRPLWLFVRTILSRPDLADKVRHLDIVVDNDTYVYSNDPEAQQVRTLMKIWLRKVWKQKKTWDRFKEAHLEREYGTGQMKFHDLAMTLLFRLHKLEALSFCFYSRPPRLSREMLEVLKASTRKTKVREPILSTLKSLHVTQPYSAEPINLSEFIRFFSLPSLEKVKGEVCAQFSGRIGDAPFNLNPKASNITEINLDRCYTNMNDMEVFLNTCRCLKKFKFRVMSCPNVPMWTLVRNGRDHQRNPIELVHPYALIEALKACSVTLEKLKLDFWEWDKPIQGDVAPWHGLQNRRLYYPSMRSFTALKHLQVEFHRLCSPTAFTPLLLEFSNLPPSLEYLHCSNTTFRSIDPKIIARCSVIPDLCPNITSVVLQGEGLQDLELEHIGDFSLIFEEDPIHIYYPGLEFTLKFVDVGYGHTGVISANDDPNSAMDYNDSIEVGVNQYSLEEYMLLPQWDVWNARDMDVDIWESGYRLSREHNDRYSDILWGSHR